MLDYFKRICVFLIYITPYFLFGNSIIGNLLPINDYYRGTVGERMFFNRDESIDHIFQINLDSRYYNFHHGWIYNGKTFDFEQYSRQINILSLSCQTNKNIRLEIRIPYVRLYFEHPIEDDKDYSHSGLSDILINATYRTLYIPNKYSSYFLAGIKIPTGYYKQDLDDLKLNLGTGSCDIPIVFRNNLSVFNVDLFLDIGYVFIGKSDGIFFMQDGKVDIGDEIFSDFVISAKVHKSIFMKFEMNWFKVFNPNFEAWEVLVSPEQSKTSLIPSIIWKPKNNRIIIEIGCLFDVWGKNTFYGISPVVKVQI